MELEHQSRALLQTLDEKLKVGKKIQKKYPIWPTAHQPDKTKEKAKIKIKERIKEGRDKETPL